MNQVWTLLLYTENIGDWNLLSNFVVFVQFDRLDQTNEDLQQRTGTTWQALLEGYHRYNR